MLFFVIRFLIEKEAMVEANTFWSAYWGERKKEWNQLNSAEEMKQTIRKMSLGERNVLHSISRSEFSAVFETICENGVSVTSVKRRHRHSNKFDAVLQKFNIVHRKQDLDIFLSGMRTR